MPAKAPERLLYVTAVAQVSYDSDSYKNKYLSYKSENNVCTLSVQDIGDDDKGTYYCAYWESDRSPDITTKFSALVQSSLYQVSYFPYSKI